MHGSCMRAGLPKEVANEQNPEIKGVKGILFGILRAAPGALTSAQIWESAEVAPGFMRHAALHCMAQGRAHAGRHTLTCCRVLCHRSRA